MFLASSWPWHSPLVQLLAGVAIAAASATAMWLARHREMLSRTSSSVHSAPMTYAPRHQRRWAQLVSIALLGIILWLPFQGVIPHPTCRVDGALLPVGAGLAVVSVAALWSAVAAALVRSRSDVHRWLVPTGLIALSWAMLAAAIVIVDTLAEGH